MLSTAIVLGGIGLTVLTLYSNSIGEPRMTAISAGLSLIFVLLTLIFVVPPLARNAGKEASQINLPFDITMGGAIMLGLLLIVGFSAWNTGNNLLFLVLSFLTAAMVVGFIAGSLMLKKVDVKMRFPESIIAGQETPIYVGLQNRKRLFPAISVVAEVRGTQRDRSIAANDLERILPAFIAKRLSKPPVIRRILDHFAFVGPNAFAETRPLHIFPNRGRFLIKDFEISTRFPFVFFRHRRRLTAKETELIVFPKPADLDRLLANIPLDQGNISSIKKGHGQELFALRDYRSNDDLRSIDWKSTARSRRLTVKEFEAEDDIRTTVILDAAMPAELLDNRTVREKLDAERDGIELIGLVERFENAVSITAAIFEFYTHRGAETKLIIGESTVGFGSDISHLRECMKRLAVVEPVPVDPSSGLNIGSILERPGRIIILSCNETEETVEEKFKNAELISF